MQILRRALNTIVLNLSFWISRSRSTLGSREFKVQKKRLVSPKQGSTGMEDKYFAPQLNPDASMGNIPQFKQES